MKLELHPNANNTLTPHAILAVNGPMIARTVTVAEGEWIVTACNEHDQLKADLANVRQDLNDARSGWESAVEAMREADHALAVAETVQHLLVDALMAVRSVAVKERRPYTMEYAIPPEVRSQIDAALAAAGVTP